jgi:hypothetical protein
MSESNRGDYPARDPQMFYDLARERHGSQADALTAADGKLGLFLSSSSALMGILVAVFALRPNSFDWWGLGLLAASGAAWLLVTGCVLLAVRAKSWRSGPRLDEVFDLCFTDEDDGMLKWRVANVFWHDYNHNASHLSQKGRALTLALVLFVTQTVLLVVALLLVASGTSESSLRRFQCPDLAARDARAARSQVRVAPRPEVEARLDLVRPQSCSGTVTAVSQRANPRGRE